MTSVKRSSVAFCAVLVFGAISLMGNTPPLQVFAVSTAEATVAAIGCTGVNNTPLATVSAESVTTTATVTAVLTAPALLPTSFATQDASAPLYLLSFLPTDIRFNPNPDKPVALVMVFSLIFKNQLGETLHVEAPRFQLSINGIKWGELSSTDFQTGQLAAYAEQSIVLQNLTIIGQTKPEQQAILACLRTQQPVDLTLSGTINAYPGNVKQVLNVVLLTPQIIMQEHKAVTQ